MFIIVSTPVVPYKGAERISTNAQAAALAVTWHYNYTITSNVSIGEYVPMIRDEIKLARIGELGNYTGWVLGFNECGVEGQAESYDSANEIVRAWRQVEQALPNAKLVSPSFMEDGSLPWSVSGYPTFAQFVAAYKSIYGTKPRLDAVSIHVYGWCKNGQHDVPRMLEYIKDKHDELHKLGYDVPIWVTEFGLIPWPGQTHTSEDAALLQREFVAGVKNIDYVERICWFQVYRPLIGRIRYGTLN
jgi:hypothetical protein